LLLKSLNVTAVALALAVSTLGLPVFAAAPADKAYTIANYPVEARAKDAVAAKERALADGQQAAFRSLLKRIVPVTAYRSLERLRAAPTADLLDGVSVRSEQNSGTEYIASLDFSFQADTVRDLLRREGIPFVDTQAPQTVLIPVMRDAKSAAGAEGEFRPASGTWAQVWQGLDLLNSVAPVRTETLRKEVHSDTLRMMSTGDGSPGRILAGEYKADRIVVAIADVDTQAKRVHVLLAGEDATGPFSWKHSYRLSDGDLAYTLELAAVVSLGVLEGRWKARQAPGGGAGAYSSQPASDIQLQVQYNGIEEWNELRRRLLETPGIDDVRIGAVSPRAADVFLKFPGGGSALVAPLAQQGLSVQGAGDTWTVRSAY
jgi:Uncharacterized protein conserved in bacteria (DUF2066)